MGSTGLVRMGVLLLALVGRCATAQEGWWRMPEIASTYGDRVDAIFVLITVITGVAFAAVVIALTYLCLRYRERPGHSAQYHDGNNAKALALTGSLAVLVFVGIDMNAVRSSNAIAKTIQSDFPDEASAIRVNVLAQQFAWNIQYPGRDGVFGKTSSRFYALDNLLGLDERDPAGQDDVITLSTLCVPVGKPVILELTSKDVIHCLFLPNMRIKQDIIPGMTTRMWFEATRVGEFEMACAELCGLGHSRMRGVLRVVTPQEFEAWLVSRAP